MIVRIEDLRALPLSERIQLVEDLWQSIAAEMESVSIPDSIAAEMDRRLDAYLATPSSALSWSEVQQRMRNRP